MWEKISPQPHCNAKKSWKKVAETIFAFSSQALTCAAWDFSSNRTKNKLHRNGKSSPWPPWCVGAEWWPMTPAGEPTFLPLHGDPDPEPNLPIRVFRFTSKLEFLDFLFWQPMSIGIKRPQTPKNIDLQTIDYQPIYFYNVNYNGRFSKKRFSALTLDWSVLRR